MVWGAPTPWSSGGRSAVSTRSGTKAWDASATQACSSAAAVPLVTTIATGSRVARARPSAKNPALRSSIRTCTRSSWRAAHARASGVEREPGQSTTSRSPSRIHSSNSVAAYVACTSLGLGTLCGNVTPRCPTSRLGPTPRVAPRLHADQGLGTSVPFHSGRNERASDSRPARARRERRQLSASLDETADLLADVLPHEPFTLGGYSFGARVALHFALRHPARVNRLVLLGATRGIRRRRRTRGDGDAATTNSRDRIETIGADGLPRRVARSRDVRVATRMTRLERAARSTNAAGLANSLATRRHRHAAMAGAGTWRRSPCRRWRSPARSIRSSRSRPPPSPTRVIDGRPRSSTDAHHAAHLEQPAASAASVTDFIDPILKTSTRASSAPSCNCARAEYFNIGKSSRPFFVENARRIAGM